MIVGIVIISLMQWSLWVLNSRDFVLSIILPTLAGEFRTLTGFQVAFGAFVLAVPLLGVLGAAFLLRTRSRQRGVEDVAPGALALRALVCSADRGSYSSTAKR